MIGRRETVCDLETFQALADMDPIYQAFHVFCGGENQIERLLGPDRGE